MGDKALQQQIPQVYSVFSLTSVKKHQLSLTW